MGEFKSLLVKNITLYRRHWFGSLLELLIPVFFAVCILVIRRMFLPQETQGSSYISNNQYSQTFFPASLLETLDQAYIKFLYNNSGDAPRPMPTERS